MALLVILRLQVMKSGFEISLNMKTLRGVVTYGCFDLGNDEQCSYEQLADNVKIITKELFKHLNIQG